MGTSEELMQRLAVSKKIMEKTEGIQRGSVDSRHMNTPVVEDYQAVPATYNLPQEFLPESNTQRHTHDPSQPIDMNRIKSSKLPDEIKRLMIEQPIVQPSSSTSNVISDEIIEGAQRLMNMNSTNKVVEQPKSRTLSENVSQPQNNTGNFNMNEMKSMIRDVVRDTVRDVVREELKDAGMIVESTSDSNEIIQFKVGKHLFVGKVTKVKKMQ
jgi:hypothetical protein